VTWHPDREAALAAPLSELSAHWIGVACSCNRMVRYPCKLLAKKVGQDVTLANVLRRLRCEYCKAKPRTAFLTDDPTGGVTGEKAWQIELAP